MKHLALAFALMVSGCVAQKETISSSFDQNEAAIINQSGSASISGQAFLKTVGGEVRTAAGNNVTLIPATNYAQERLAYIYGAGKCASRGVNFTNDNPSFHTYTKNTKADADGRFKFNGLAAGNYYLVTQITWGVPGQYGINQTGCAVYEYVQLGNGQAAEVLLTGE